MQVSRGWGAGGNSHTLLVYLENVGIYLVDFARGVGLSNWRQPAAGPSGDLAVHVLEQPGDAADRVCVHRVAARATEHGDESKVRHGDFRAGAGRLAAAGQERRVVRVHQGAGGTR